MSNPVLPTDFSPTMPASDSVHRHSSAHNAVNAVVNDHEKRITLLEATPGGTGAVTSVAGRTGNITLSYGDISGLATVASTGAYGDLTGKPTLATVATSGSYIDLTGRPSLATVATSGAYSDLTGKPSIQAPITLTTTGTSGAATFDGVTLNIPTYTSGGGGSTTLAGLTDVAITSPTNGQALIYNSSTSKWNNQTLPGGDMLKATYDPAGIAQQLVGTTATQALTHKDLTGTGNTFPTFNQSTTGTAANITGVAAIANGGTGQTTAAAGFNALSPLTILGDLLYASGANANARLAGNATTTKKFLTQTGTGTASAAPSWATIAAADVPTLNQSTTGNAGSATKLATARLINGVSFDGTSNITVTDSTAAKTANNLSDLASASSARTNLGLGTAATMVGPASAIVGATDTQTIQNKTIDQTNSITFNNVTVVGGQSFPVTPAAGLSTFFGIGSSNVRPGWMNQTGILERIATDQGMTGFGQAWQNPTLGTGWANLDAGGAGAYGGPQYMMDGLGFVHLRGLAKNSSATTNTNGSNATIFTLPVGYRPSQRVRVGADFSDAFGEIDIMDTGAVIIAGGSPSNVAPGAWASLNNIVFRAEQ